MTRKMIGFGLFVATNVALIILSVIETNYAIHGILFALIAAFYAIGLKEHLEDLKK